MALEKVVEVGGRAGGRGVCGWGGLLKLSAIQEFLIFSLVVEMDHFARPAPDYHM